MRSIKLWVPLLACVILVTCAAEGRRVRARPRPIQQEEQQEVEVEVEENRPQPVVQYYRGEPRDNAPQQVLIASDDEYNGYYGQPTIKARADFNRGGSPTTTPTPRTKDQSTKAPPVMTIRNYNKVNDDGSFTFGYESADGSFKEETRGTDCVVRGKYGYVDPDGNKREFTYVSGNPCDPNNPDGEEEDNDRSEEDSNENIPQNYPQQRPIAKQQPIQRPAPRPTPTTTARPATTVFQNDYANTRFRQQVDEEENIAPIQYVEPKRPIPASRPYVQPQQIQEEVTIRQRPRITINTTPAPASIYQTQPTPVSITPRPTYRIPAATYQTEQPPATTYRPAFQFNSATQKPAAVVYSRPAIQQSYPATTQQTIISPYKQNELTQSSTRGQIDFNAEFQKFQQEHNIYTTTPRITQKPYKSSPKQKIESPVTSNPIYESQLVFDPSSGQYDSSLYQQLPQSEGDFSLNHRIQPYVHQQQFTQPQFNLNQFQPQASALYRPQPIQAAQPAPFSQQIYHKEQNQLQVSNSQQLYQQQQELQQQQLQQDRVEAARKAQAQAEAQNQQHRFQVQQQLQSQPSSQTGAHAQSFYYVQPAGGQIDSFLQRHNLQY